MDLQYGLTREDFEAAWRGHRPFFAGEMVASALLAVSGLAILSIDAGSPFAWAYTVVGAFLVVRGQWQLHRLRRHWAEAAESLTQVHLTVSEEGLFARTPHVATKVEWAEYTDSHEIDSGFLLYRGGTYVFIPKRAFPSGAEADAFRVIVGRRIERRRWIRIRRRAGRTGSTR
jgi:hypothetical protein